LTITSATSRATFAYPSQETNQPVLYAFEATVENPQGERAKDTVYAIVLHRNKPPVAVISGDMSVDRDDVIVLSAAASTDPEHDGLKYMWYQSGGPPVRLSTPLGPQTVVSFPDAPVGIVFPCTITMSLRATDSLGASAETKSSILVTDASTTFMQAKKPFGALELNSTTLLHSERRRQKLTALVSDEEAQITAALGRKDWAAVLAHLQNVLSVNPTRALPVKAADDANEGAIRQGMDVMQKGHAEFRAKNYLSAMRWYRQADGILPGNPLTPSLLQACVTALDEQSQARETPTTGLAMNNTKSRALYSVGLRHYSSGELTLAADMWKRALKLDPNNRMASAAYHRVIEEMQQ
jgi:hypothetical protein